MSLITVASHLEAWVLTEARERLEVFLAASLSEFWRLAEVFLAASLSEFWRLAEVFLAASSWSWRLGVFLLAGGPGDWLWVGAGHLHSVHSDTVATSLGP